MKESVTIALLQFESVLGDPAANRKKAEKMAREAAQQGAQLICFPELFTTGYNLDLIGDHIQDMAESLDGPTVKTLGRVAKETGVFVIAPMALREAEKDRPLNAAVLIGSDGQVAGVYAKCHLFEKERLYFQEGNAFPVFDTPLGRIGIMICFDAGFPEAARCLKLHGAEIIICPSAWRIQDLSAWQLNMPQRALENTCFVAAVNRFGQEGTLYMGGYSMVCGPHGAVLAQARKEEETMVTATLWAKELEEGPYLPYRRPQLYKKEGI